MSKWHYRDFFFNSFWPTNYWCNRFNSSKSLNLNNHIKSPNKFSLNFLFPLKASLLKWLYVTVTFNALNDANTREPTIHLRRYWHYWFMWFVVIRRALCIRNCFEPNTVRKIINTDLYRLIFMIWKRKKWGLSTYISLILEISIIGKIVGFRLFWVFVEIVLLSKNIREITYYPTISHMITNTYQAKWINFKVSYQFQSASKADAIFGISELLDFELWTLDAGLLTLDAERYTLNDGLWALDTIVGCFEQNQKPVSDSGWQNYWKFFGCVSLSTSWSRLFYRL